MPPIIDRIDSPERKFSGRQRKWLIIIGALVVLFILARVTLSYWLDLLWFSSLGYSEMFWRTRVLEAGVFTVFTVATFVILFVALKAIHRSQRASLPLSARLRNRTRRALEHIPFTFTRTPHARRNFHILGR